MVDIYLGWIRMVSGQGLRQRQQVVHIFTVFAEVDKTRLLDETRQSNVCKIRTRI